MKRKIALICCLVLVAMSLVTVFAACNNDNLTDDDLMSLRSNLYYQYKDDKAEQTKNYKVVSEITGFDADRNEIKCSVAWTIDGPSSVSVSSDKDENGYYTINVPVQATLADSISYTLTGTLVNAKGEAYTGYKGDENAVYSVSFNRTLTKLGGDNILLNHYLPDVLDSTAMDTEYNLTMYNGAENYVYYFTGTKSGNYLATSDQLSNSKKVKLEATDGGFYIFFDNNGTKNYITLTDNTGSSSYAKASISLTEAASTVFSFEADLQNALKATISTTISGKETTSTFYLGGQSAYKTISTSESYYVTGSNAANVDSTQCVVRLVGDGDYNQYGGRTLDNAALAFRASAVADPVADVAYKLAVYKGTEILYFNGEVKATYYLGVTTVKENGVDCYIEKADDGFYIYFMSGDTKTYVTIELSGTHINAVMSSSVPGNGVFKMDTATKVPYMEFNSSKYFMDSAAGQSSISANSWSNLNTDNMDVSQWVVRLVPSAD